MRTFAADKDHAILWARMIMKNDFLVIDTETTGLNHDDEAVSIALVNQAGEILVSTLLRHTKRSHPKAEAVHGITWEMTRDAPKFADILPRLRSLLENKGLIGYNLDFDRRVIARTCGRYSLDWLPPPGADVMSNFAAYYGDWNDYRGSYTWQKLTFAAAHFGLDTSNTHTAAGDALLTLEIAKRMAETKLSTED